MLSSPSAVATAAAMVVDVSGRISKGLDSLGTDHCNSDVDIE